MSLFLLFLTLPSPFAPASPTFLFLLPWKDFAELYRQSDWFLCLHRPLQRAADNEPLLWKWRVRGGGFSCNQVGSPGWEITFGLIRIEERVTGENHPVTSNHEWPKSEACFTNTLLNEEKCKSTSRFRNLNSFSRQWDKKAECLGKSHLFPINLLLLASSLFYSGSIKIKNKKEGIKNSPWNHVLWHLYSLPLSSLFPLCTGTASCYMLLGRHTWRANFLNSRLNC